MCARGIRIVLDVDAKESPELIGHTEAQLRQEREELRGVVDLIPQTIVVLNPNGKTVYANRVALDYTGLSLDEVQSDDFRPRAAFPCSATSLGLNVEYRALSKVGFASCAVVP
jgi:PAS domain-containing protein